MDQYVECIHACLCTRSIYKRNGQLAWSGNTHFDTRQITWPKSVETTRGRTSWECWPCAAWILLLHPLWFNNSLQSSQIASGSASRMVWTTVLSLALMRTLKYAFSWVSRALACTFSLACWIWDRWSACTSHLDSLLDSSSKSRTEFFTQWNERSDQNTERRTVDVLQRASNKRNMPSASRQTCLFRERFSSHTSTWPPTSSWTFPCHKDSFLISLS